MGLKLWSDLIIGLEVLCLSLHDAGRLGDKDREVPRASEVDIEAVHRLRLDGGLHGPQGEHDALHAQGGGRCH